MGIQELNSEELIKRTLERAEKDQVRNISLQFTDVVGVLKNVTIPVERLEESVRYGVWFDGSSIEGFARIAESDMFLVPDLNTFAVIPWERGDETTARAICSGRGRSAPRPVTAAAPWRSTTLGTPLSRESTDYLLNTIPRETCSGLFRIT